MHGLGSMNWPDGRFYQGDFSCDQRQGYGMFRFADGSYYKGDFKENKYHGTGTLTCADGQVLSGFWSEGTLVKRAEDNGSNISHDYGQNQNQQFRQLSSRGSWHKNNYNANTTNGKQNFNKLSDGNISREIDFQAIEIPSDSYKTI